MEAEQSATKIVQEMREGNPKRVKIPPREPPPPWPNIFGAPHHLFAAVALSLSLLTVSPSCCRNARGTARQRKWSA